MGDMCIVPGCSKPVYRRSKFYCCRHGQQIYRHGKILKKTIHDLNKITKHKHICKIELYKASGEIVGHAIIDREDYALVKNIRWGMNPAGYVVCGAKNGSKYLHAVINKTPRGKKTDHIDGNKLNNRKSNLRVVTTSQNAQNMKNRKTGTSRFKGVSRKRNRWQARIMINRKTTYLGSYDKEIDAARAYDKAAKEYFGKHANPNGV